MAQLKRINTRNMSREEWLELRRKSIGGSDAAGIIGLSSYSSPYSIWANKTGRLPDGEDNESMRIGRDLEAYVAKRWEEVTGKTVRRNNALLINSQYPFAHADIDRVVLGEKAGLECKTTSTLNIKQFHGIDFPEKYYVQCVHYLAVTGYDRWYLAVLVLGKGFYTFTLERNEDEIHALMKAEKEFWDLVESDTPPTLDGSDCTSEALQSIYKESRNTEITLYGRENLLKNYLNLKNEKKVLDEKISVIENTIKAEMQDSEYGICGAYSISWKSQSRQLFQPKEFAKQHPEIDLQPFYKSSTARPFKVTEKKQEVM